MDQHSILPEFQSFLQENNRGQPLIVSWFCCYKGREMGSNLHYWLGFFDVRKGVF